MTTSTTWPDWKPGDRVSIAHLNGSYKERDNPGRWDFGNVILVGPLCINAHLGPMVLIGLADGEVTWRHAADVHEEWHYWPEKEFREMYHKAWQAAVWSDDL